MCEFFVNGTSFACSETEILCSLVIRPTRGSTACRKRDKPRVKAKIRASTVLATRAVSQAVLTWLDQPNRACKGAPGTEDGFADKAAADEAHTNWPGATVAETAGAGRVPRNVGAPWVRDGIQ